MDLFQMMININGEDIENTLKQAIKNVKEELAGLIEERTCKIYSSYLLQELTKKHISARLINTLDLGLNYEHQFLIIPLMGEYILADLTFSQFNKRIDELEDLLENGYQKITNEEMNLYLKIISKTQIETNFTIDKIVYLSNSFLEEDIIKR